MPLDITRFIAFLSSIKQDSGDIRLILEDADTGDLFELQESNFSVEHTKAGDKFLKVAVNYIKDTPIN